MHEGGDRFVTLPASAFTKEQISPARDTRLRWMQSVLHCTHYVAGAGEKAYLRPEEAPKPAETSATEKQPRAAPVAPAATPRAEKPAEGKSLEKALPGDRK